MCTSTLLDEMHVREQYSRGKYYLHISCSFVLEGQSLDAQSDILERTAHLGSVG